MGKKSREDIQQKKEIKLSYVLPTYNRVEYLGECLLTLTEQDFPREEYEIVVVDDGSTDSTPELMKHFTKKFKNIRYYKRKHIGVESARNFGNRKARGEIIAVCDSDDLYHDSRTKVTLKFFKRNKKTHVMNGSYVEINHQGLPIRKYTAHKTDAKAFLSGKQAYFCHDNCAYRKEVAKVVPYRKGQQTDDWKFVHDLLKKGYKIGFVEDELCKVRTLNIGIMGERRQRIGLKLPYA